MDSQEAAALRDAMVDGLRAAGAVRSAAVERAMRQVPRERFLPAGVPPGDAYADRAVVLSEGDGGFPASTASQPTIVAGMLEQLDVRPGQRVLEIGTAGGYNAALLGRLAGPDGRVVSLEIDRELAERAADRLAGPAGAPVEVRAVDGAAGAPDAAPFDRIQATAGVWDIPPAWLGQLAPDGRLVVPLWLCPGLEVSVAFDRDGDVLRGDGCRPCAFLRLRGAHAGPDGYRPLGGGAFVAADSLDRAGAAALGRVLADGPAAAEALPEPPPGWFARLALADRRAVQVFSLSTQKAASGLYDPRARAAALVQDGELVRYGDARALAAELGALLEEAAPFDPAGLRIIAHPAGTPAREAGRWTLDRPHFRYHLSD